ncbi:MAG TPA: hypothetical protein VMO00_12305 [Methylomirabilota bacterium]|nr:hypothetical protein [Methylomirabilota bacterium]
MATWIAEIADAKVSCGLQYLQPNDRGASVERAHMVANRAVPLSSAA